jgi:hypothetical protein
MEKVYSRGEIIIKEGEQDKVLYLLKSGTLGILKSDRLVMEIRDSGTIFGEMSILLDQPRSATVKALTLCVVEVYEVDVDSLPEDHPQITNLILGSLAKRLAEATTKLYRCMLAEDENKAAILGSSATSFEDLTAIDDRAIEQVLKIASNDDLVAALLGATPRVRDKFFSNMSRRNVDRIKEDMYIAISFCTQRTVESAKLRILKEVAAFERSELDLAEAVRIGEILIKMRLITASQLQRWLQRQKEEDILRHKRLGEILVEFGLITEEERDTALKEQQRRLQHRT